MDRRSFLAFAGGGLASLSLLGSTSFGGGTVATATAPPMTTWFPADFDCLICKTKNTFQVVGSYGSYIYAWPSKYQWVFWPWTDSPSIYFCKGCHLVTFMGDFEKLPKEKFDALKTGLAKIPFDRKFKEYTEVPMTERLQIAETVYTTIGGRDDEFWNRFYRIQGYHFAREKQPEKAKEVRKKALSLTQKMLADATDKAPKKELLYISGAMKHFLADDKGALEDLRKGLETKFAAPDMKPEVLANAETGMNERLNDYIKRIGSSNPPRSADTDEDD